MKAECRVSGSAMDVERSMLSVPSPQLFLCLILFIVLSATSGCNLGGRPINYAPQVTENLQYLQRTSQEMAESAREEIAKSQSAEQLQPLLAAIVRGSVSEVQKSLGGFYLAEGATYEAVTQGGAGTGPRDLDPVEKAQLDVLIEKVILTQKYGESVNNFYDR